MRTTVDGHAAAVGRTVRSTALGVAALCGVLLSASLAIAAEECPNILLVIVDTLRADRLEASRNGTPLMPNLRTLAGSSVFFKEAYSQEAFTKPSVTSILTSLYPTVHGVRFGVIAPNGQIPSEARAAIEVRVDVLSPELTTLPKVLKRCGYSTVAVQTNMQLTADCGFASGFDHYEYLGPVPADVVTKRALVLLGALEEPFFAYLHYMDPHMPYAPPGRVSARLGTPPETSEQDQALVRQYGAYYIDMALHVGGFSETRRLAHFSDSGREYIRFMYDAEVLFADEQLCSVVTAVKALDRPSLTVVTSDHGEELWEHGSVGHTKTAYRELAHVPLVMSAAKLGHKTIDQPVETLDIAPTIAAYLGLDVESGWQGRSLLPMILGERAGPRAVFTVARGMQPWSPWDWEAVLFEGQRLVLDSVRGKAGLFSLQGDPFEQHNLVSGNPGQVRALEALLEDFRERNARHPLRQSGVSRVGAHQETIEALRALGYLGASTSNSE